MRSRRRHPGREPLKDTEAVINEGRTYLPPGDAAGAEGVRRILATLGGRPP